MGAGHVGEPWEASAPRAPRTVIVGGRSPRFSYFLLRRAWAALVFRRPPEPDPTNAVVPRWRVGGRLKFWFLVLVGLLLLLGGAAMALSGGEERGPGVTVAFFGLGLILTTPLFKAWKPRGKPTIAASSRPGQRTTGLSFPYSLYMTLVAAFAMICMGAACGGIALFRYSFTDPGESATTPLIFGTVGALFFLGDGIVVLIKKAGEGGP